MKIDKTLTQITRLILTSLLALLAITNAAFAAGPLPSWNDTAHWAHVGRYRLDYDLLRDALYDGRRQSSQC